MIQRREFIMLVGGTMAGGGAWTAASNPGDRSDQQRVSSRVCSSPSRVPPGFTRNRFAEGRNVAIEYRWAEGDYDRLPALAADLVRHRVTVIAALGAPAALPSKAAAAMIPVVFLTGDDAVRAGLVASFNRPGGNLTGVSLINVDLTAKRLELLRDLVPQAAIIAALVNPKNPSAEASKSEVLEAARAVTQRVEILSASTLDEIEHAFKMMAELQSGALLITTVAFFIRQSSRLAALAASHSMPSVHIVRDFPAAGGLMRYGPSLTDSWRQVGLYVGRILKGEKPADLPVSSPPSSSW